MRRPEEPSEEASMDPDGLTRALEQELVQKRVSWQRARARRGTWRALSLLFVFVILLGALLAFFYFLPDLRNREGEKVRPAKTEGSR